MTLGVFLVWLECQLSLKFIYFFLFMLPGVRTEPPDSPPLGNDY